MRYGTAGSDSGRMRPLATSVCATSNCFWNHVLICSPVITGCLRATHSNGAAPAKSE